MTGKNYQLEFPVDPAFQEMLRALQSAFSKVSGRRFKINEIVHLCVIALQDVTEAHILAALGGIDLSLENGGVRHDFQRTCFVSSETRAVVSHIQNYLLETERRHFSLREILLAIIIIGNGLDSDKISYILSEYLDLKADRSE